MLGLHLKTLFSFSFYHRLAQASCWQMLWFAVYIFLLSVTVFTFYAGNYTEKQLPLLLKNFPEVTFTKGVLTAPEGPVSVRVPETDFSIVFDNKNPVPASSQELAERQIVMLVRENYVYMPGAAGLQARKLPEQMDFTTSQTFLSAQVPALKSMITAMAFCGALFLFPLMMLAAFGAAVCIGLFWRAAMRMAVPVKTLCKWAVFLLGPASALWLINLFWPVPLFALAELVLLTIYLQQIFNTYPREN